MTKIILFQSSDLSNLSDLCFLIWPFWSNLNNLILLIIYNVDPFHKEIFFQFIIFWKLCCRYDWEPLLYILLCCITLLAEQFQIEHLLKKNPYELSGGEKQRVAICRALINNPDLILADEPTGNLDSKSGKIVIDALNKISSEYKKTIVMVTHDPQMASYCSRLILLKDGVILEDLKNSGNQDAFYQEILGKMKEL